ncbi:MAG: thioredoxin family protein [Planctomycetota bacterium]
MVWNLALMMAVALGLSVGCDRNGVRSGRLGVEDESAVPYITSADLSKSLASEPGAMLVEFCVPVGCYRCDEMRPQVDNLAETRANRASVYRVNLVTERPFAQQQGITMCPTYVAFVDGEEVFRAAYPTTGEMLASELDRLVEQMPISQPQSDFHNTDESVH